MPKRHTAANIIYQHPAEDTQSLEKDYFIDLVTADIYRVMKERGITKADLARIMRTSPANITQILNGTRNFTLGKLVDIASALGAKLSIGMSSRVTQGTLSYYNYSPFSFGSDKEALLVSEEEKTGLLRHIGPIAEETMEGVSLLSVDIIEVSLKRHTFSKHDMAYDFSTEIGICPLKDQHYAEVLLKISIRGKKDRSVQLDTSILGMFRLDDLNSLPGGIDEFLHVSAPQIIYPYLKDIVDKTVRTADLPPVNLPEYDFKEMYEAKNASGKRLSC